MSNKIDDIICIGDEVIIATSMPKRKVVFSIYENYVEVKEYDVEKGGVVSENYSLATYPKKSILGVGKSLFYEV